MDNDYRHSYKSTEDVHQRALEIIGKTRPELIKETNYKVKGKKNAMGDLFEAWFGKTIDNNSEPDLGIVELKATPYKEYYKSAKSKKQLVYTAKERLVMNLINFNDIVDEDFETSHFLHKSKNLEIAFYEAIKQGKKVPLDDLSFQYVLMYEMAEHPEDFSQIKRDWELIKQYVKTGHAEDLSESLTEYLGACPKGRNKQDTVKQPKSEIKAMRRAFSLKTRFMTYVLNKFVLHTKGYADHIVKKPEELKKKSLNKIILERFKPYIGKTQEELMKELDVHSKAKSRNSIIIDRMIKAILKVSKLTDIQEFEKASIVPKTVQFNENGTNDQSMSLPTFQFKELVKQNWTNEDGEPEADLNNYLYENKFLFIVFQENHKGENVFKGAKFYSIPLTELNGPIKSVWEDTKHKLLTGVHIVHKGKQNLNDFIGMGAHEIVHVRPHSSKSSYVNNQYANQLPHPAIWTNKPAEFSYDYMTTQSFWLNGTYVRKAVKDLLD